MLRILLTQLIATVLLGLFFGFAQTSLWGYSALVGGVSVWLPNIIFMARFRFIEVSESPTRRQITTLATWEALKMVLTIVLLIVSLGILKASYFPCITTYLVVFILQILAPAVLSRIR